MRRYFDTPWATPCLAVAAALALLAGCGGSDPIADEPAAASTSAPTPTATPTADPSAVPTLTKPPAAGAIGSPGPTDSPALSEPDGMAYAMPPGRPGRFPVAHGRIVAVEGASFWLEGAPRPMVHWAEPTTFTEFSAAARSDLAVGKCARVRPSRMAGGSGRPQPQHLAARTVVLSEAVDGICAPTPSMGPGGRGDVPPRPDGPGPRFDWRPAPAGPGLPRDGFSGLVTAIDGDSFTIEMRRRDVGPAGTSAEPVAQRVTITAETAWQSVATVDSSAVQVGKCATATGRPAGPGHFFAESVTLRPAEDDQCRREGPGRAGPGGPGDRRGPGFGHRPDGHERPRFRDRDERREPRRENRPREERPEAPSAGSGAGGGAASGVAR